MLISGYWLLLTSGREGNGIKKENLLKSARTAEKLIVLKCSGEDCTHKCPCSGQGQKVRKVMVQPINLIFRYLQNRSRIQVWLYEQVNMQIEGCIIGFDEYMNLVLDDAEEIHSKTKSRKQLGRIMLKGDNITLLQSVSS
ncbi:small nuclear ribonucleoprotein E-like [Bos javanicus]|uniref:small nuclear ribonucleoprotein E-like n=1 Tax=Bos javanicus TaxID=9906 RepID=UPI002AA8E0CC|nr:small nuclear ribonucleoprotein E-like [Bos javanicus]